MRHDFGHMRSIPSEASMERGKTADGIRRKVTRRYGVSFGRPTWISPSSTRTG